MTDSDRSPDVVERAMARLCDEIVPHGPSSRLVADTARRLHSVETDVSLREKRRKMMFRFARYTSVAAALTVLLGTVVWITLLDRSASVAFAEVKNQVERVLSVQYVKSRTTNGKPDKTRREKILGRYLTRTEVLGADGKIEHIYIRDAKNGRYVSIDPKRKEFVILGSQVSRDLDGGNETEEEMKPMPEVDFYKSVREVPNEPTKRLPEKMLSGRMVTGFYFEEKDGGSTWKRTYWIDAETTLPVRIEISSRHIDPQFGPSDWVMAEFVFNEELDASLFSTEPPAGYTVKTKKVFGIRIP